MKRALVLAGLLLAGCAGAPEAGQAPEEMVTRTVVHLHGDAPPEVQVSQITTEEHEAELAGRLGAASVAEGAPALQGPERVGVAQAAIATDSCSDGAALWAFDKTVANQSTANEICFYGAGTADLTHYILALHLYPMPPTYWADHVMSYWPGTESGYFTNGWAEFAYEDFASYQPDTNASYNAQHGTSVTLD